MISGKEKWLWVLSAAVLAVLFLASSTNLLIKEKETVVYPISVIIDDTTDDFYVNFRKGVDQAALELHTDVRFITLYEAGGWPEQMELILREMRDGADALVISPLDARLAGTELTGERISVPVILLSSESGRTAAVDGEDITHIIFDYYGLGKLAGEAIARNHEASRPVCLLGMKGLNGPGEDFKSGLSDVLEAAGFSMSEYEWDRDREGSFPAVAAQMLQGRSRPVVAALDPHSLLKTADMMNGGEDLDIDGLYGRGTSVPILNHLAEGRISGLCVTDDYTAGYLSVRTAVERIGHVVTEKDMVLKSAYIEQEDLYRSEYEKMLYPIE